MSTAYHPSSDSGSDRVDGDLHRPSRLRVLRIHPHPTGAVHRHQVGEPRVHEPAVQADPRLLGLRLPDRGHVSASTPSTSASSCTRQRNFSQTPFSKGLSENIASGHATSGVATTVDARYSDHHHVRQPDDPSASPPLQAHTDLPSTVRASHPEEGSRIAVAPSSGFQPRRRAHE